MPNDTKPNPAAALALSRAAILDSPVRILDPIEGTEIKIDAPAAIAAADRKQRELDFFLNIPFLPKTDAARKGVVFHVLRIGDRVKIDPATGEPATDKTSGEVQDEWVLGVQLAHDCILAGRNDPTPIDFKKDDFAILTLSQGAIRDKVIENLRADMQAFGAIPNRSLREIRSKNKAHANPIVLCAGRYWEPLGA